MLKKLVFIFLLTFFVSANMAIANPFWAELGRQAVISAGGAVGEKAIDYFMKFFNANSEATKKSVKPQLHKSAIPGNARHWILSPRGNLRKAEIDSIAVTLKKLDKNRDQIINDQYGSVIAETQSGNNIVLNNVRAHGPIIINSYQPIIPKSDSVASGKVEDKCKSPYNYIKKVSSLGNGFISYDLAPDFKYQKINVVFFGENGGVLRSNTIVPLDDKLTGSFKIPERALRKPVQRGFNFIITDVDGCERWGVVNEMALQDDHQVNKLKIGGAAGGTMGIAFVIDDLVQD